MAPSLRDQQPYVPGMGKSFVTPKKKSRGGLRNKQAIQFMGRASQLAQLQNRLEALRDIRASGSSGSSASSVTPAVSATPVYPSDDAPSDIPSSDIDCSDTSSCSHTPGPSSSRPESLSSSPRRPKRRRPVPETVKKSLYKHWKTLLPDLVDPMLEYMRRTAGLPVATFCQPVHACSTTDCMPRTQEVLLLFWDHYQSVPVPFCDCTSLPCVLVTSGMFPTAPSQPRTAVSMDLLDFYLALFERSGDAVTALARALQKFYTRRGWRILDGKGSPIAEPFRKPLSRAVQWYDSLRTVMERRIDDAIERARTGISDHLRDIMTTPPCALEGPAVAPTAGAEQGPPLSGPSSLPIPNDADETASPSDIPSDVNPPGSDKLAGRRTCSSLLQSRCPACFGGDTFGRRFADGADIIVAADGNFSHRHMRSAGDSRSFYDPKYFIPKEEVDRIGEFIDRQRKKTPSKSWVPKVPDEAVDSCKNGHEAADEKNTKTNADRFDDTGVMALVCTHDIPLFVVNIDTPGEQQKQVLTLFIHLFKHILDDATVVGLYDIGCVTERSIGRYDLLPPEVVGRLIWALSAMHAYGHEWSCQLVYNPRLQPGIGLRDGEGVERLWSRLRVFIAVTRTSARSRRIWILDRQLYAIGIEMRDNLGNWLLRKLKHGINEQYHVARAIVVETNISVNELRHQWMLQRRAQLSIRAHAPKGLKKEVDAILALQEEIGGISRSMQMIKTQFQENGGYPQAADLLSVLQEMLDGLNERAETLYTSLNISQMFPEVEGLDAEVVRALLLAHDLKINIRKRVIAQLLEFDRIDRAAGGRDNPLGTKLHQQTRKAISRRQPAILTAIRRYNKYCQTITDLYAKQKTTPTIPVPQPLSTNIAVLREDPALYEDVWITSPASPDRPQWLENAEMRKAIRALLKMDRCVEEEARLVREAGNLCRWFGMELAATELAMQTAENSLYIPLLQQRRDDMALLQLLWVSPPLITPAMLQTRADWAHGIVSQIISSTAIGEKGLPSSSYGTAFPVLDDEDYEDDDEEGLADTCTLVDDIDDVQMLDVVEELAFDYGEDHGNSDDEPINPSPDDEEMAISDREVPVKSPSLEPCPSDADPDSTEYEPEIRIDFLWQVPGSLRVDAYRELSTAHFPGHSRYIPCTRVLTSSHTSRGVVIEPDDYARLADTDGLLTSDCVNGCATLLQRNIKTPFAEACAIFSTYDIVSASRDDDGGVLMRSVKRIPYAERPIWLIPIHRPGDHNGIGHWTLVVANIPRQTLYQFDSFASKSDWRTDIQRAWTLIQRLCALAALPPPRTWRAVPLSASAVQTNSSDCGVWILAVMAAQLRGYDMTALREEDIPQFRRYLCFLVTQLAESM